MGIKGLATFLKENRQSLCTTVQFPSSSSSSASSTSTTASCTPIVVDAWGIIYQLFLDSLTWTHGGEYLRFYRLARRLVESLRQVGLEPTFVFDGSSPPEKHDTILGRLKDSLRRALLFHTTSVSSRSAPSFSKFSPILPPFTSQAFIHALHSLNVNIHCVPAGEADGLCVSLADELGAYILGLDSDFMILISSPAASNVKGYCPLDMLQWIDGAGESSMSRSSSQQNGDHDDWSCARIKRREQATRSSALLPASSLISPTLVLTVVAPNALKSRLRLPPSVLPLFASLVGNDYTPPRYAEIFFEGGLSHVQKIEKVARLLREIVFAPSYQASTSNAGDQAFALVKKAVAKLAIRGFISDTEMQEMVDVIIEATFQYVLPGLPNETLAHPFDATTNFDDNEHVQLARERYAALQRAGMASGMTHAYQYPGRIYLWPILEDTSGPSLRASEALREVRKETWMIIEEACGGLCWPPPDAEQLRMLREDEELLDLLGVTKEIEASMDSSDETTLVGEAGEEGSEAGSIARLKYVAARLVREYVRQGSSQRIAEVRIALPPLSPSTGVPQCLGPIEVRLRRYLEIMSSDTPAIVALPPALHPLVANIRLCILEAAARSGRTDGRWRRTEVVAILKVALGMYAAWEKEDLVFKARRGNEETNDNSAAPILHSRPAALIAQINAIMIDQLVLAQALLLLPDDYPDTTSPGLAHGKKDKNALKPRLTHLTPFMFFSGIGIHTVLNAGDPPMCTGWRWSPAEDALLDTCAEAVCEGIEDAVLGWSTNGSPSRSVHSLPEVRTKAGGKKDKAQPTLTKDSGATGRFDLLKGMTS